MSHPRAEALEKASQRFWTAAPPNWGPRSIHRPLKRRSFSTPANLGRAQAVATEAPHSGSESNGQHFQTYPSLA